MKTAENLTDEQIQAAGEYLKSAGMNFDKVDHLVAGALGVCEPNRNHSRHELARLQTAILFGAAIHHLNARREAERSK